MRLHLAALGLVLKVLYSLGFIAANLGGAGGGIGDRNIIVIIIHDGFAVEIISLSRFHKETN